MSSDMELQLRESVLFSQLNRQQIDRVIRHAGRVSLDEGQALFEQGDPADRFYLLVKGQVKLYRLSPEGDEKVIEIIMPGSTFAEALMFQSEASYPVGAIALSDAELISIDADDFVDLLKGSVDTCFALLGDMSQRMRGLLREIDELSLHSATARLAAWLVQHASAEDDTVEFPVAKQVLASRLSIKPETFSRILKNFSNCGIITVVGTKVTIHQRDHLERVANVCAMAQDSLQSSFIISCPLAAGKG